MRDRLSPQQRQVLEALRDHPFLTARQLSWHLRQNNAAIQRHLWQMQRRSLVRRYPLFVAGERKVQWLYTLTTQGLQTIAGTTGTFLSAYQQKHGYSISRLRWLALVAERIAAAGSSLTGTRKPKSAMSTPKVGDGSPFNALLCLRIQRNDGCR